MIQHKFTSKIPISPGAFRYKVRIVSVECTPDTEESRKVQFELLKMITNDLSLTQTKDQPFAKLSMYHTGKYWEIACERDIKEP